MRVLLLGSTGNLGSRILPALLAHDQEVVAYVRSSQKLINLIDPELIKRIDIVEGDAFDTTAVANALREYRCDALVNSAGNREPIWKEQTLGKLVASITSAAILVGRERKQPLRAWIIGGMGSLQYPGTNYQIQDYLPSNLSAHHHGTERVMKGLSTNDLTWTLLCVAMMYPESERITLLNGPRRHSLAVGVWTPPGWKDHWLRNVPFLGPYLNLFPVISSYSTKYEDVADLIAEDLDRQEPRFVGQFVGYKDLLNPKTA